MAIDSAPKTEPRIVQRCYIKKNDRIPDGFFFNMEFFGEKSTETLKNTKKYILY